MIRLPRLFFLPLSIAPATVLAANNQLPSAAGSVLQMILGLAIVLGVMFGALHLLRRLQNGHTGMNSGMKIVGATSVGPREKVVLLSVGSKVLVLGVTTGEITALHTMDASELPPPAPQDNPPLPEFARRLRQFMEKRNAR